MMKMIGKKSMESLGLEKDVLGPFPYCKRNKQKTFIDIKQWIKKLILT